MSTDVIMPALGMAQETGTVLRWYHGAGESVTKGEPLLEIETDKTTAQIEAPASGVLANVTAGAGDTVPVGRVIAIIAAPEASAAVRQADEPRVPASPVATRLAAEHNLDLSMVKPAGDRIRKDDVLEYLATRQRGLVEANGVRRVAASPKARRIADELRIDLTAVAGSGPEGAVLATDVLAIAAPSASAQIDVLSDEPASSPASLGTPPAAQEPPMSPVAPAATQEKSISASAPRALSSAAEPTSDIVRPATIGRLMAQRTTDSFRDTPHFYLSRELPAHGLIDVRARLLTSIERRTGVRLSITDLLIRILAEALAAHPLANAEWRDGAIHRHPTVNLGVAAATPQGLLVPVIRDAARKNLATIAGERADLARRAVAGILAPDDLSGSTATLSNLGMYDVDMFQAIINPPHSSILAVGRVAERPVVRGGQIVAAHTVWVTGSFDHRVLDGASAAKFLRTFATLVEEPLGLL